MYECRTSMQHGPQPRWHPSLGSWKLSEGRQQRAMALHPTAAEGMRRGCGTVNKGRAAMQSSTQHLISAACRVWSLLLLNRCGYYSACTSTLLHGILSCEREAYAPSVGFV